VLLILRVDVRSEGPLVTPITTGYEGSDPDPKDLLSPSDSSWSIELDTKISSESFHGTIFLNGEPIGMVRVPTMEHLGWLREKFQQKGREG